MFMCDPVEQSIADSLEADQILLPHMDTLLQDLWALGCSIDHIIDVISSLNLKPDQTRILDLGCGKGAVCIQIAERFGFQAVGVDVMESFLKDAREKASEHGVSHLCRFIKQDMRTYVSDEHDFDLVILASLGGILGSIRNTVGTLRTQVRSGGYMMIDDGYLRNAPALSRKGYSHYRNHEESIQELTVFNDLLVREVNTTDFSLEINGIYMQAIEKRGKELADHHPELKKDIEDYIRLQAEECEVIDYEIEGALWLIQKR
ncbi:class I SAM-dependent methyltransferase [bacterium]|nr:class I SAM-dependent methyltransferase [bacterium]